MRTVACVLLEGRAREGGEEAGVTNDSDMEYVVQLIPCFCLNDHPPKKTFPLFLFKKKRYGRNGFCGGICVYEH